MPIRPENRARYPANWREISSRIRFTRARGRCERCEARHGDRHPETGAIVVLTTAHLNHVPEDCRDENLAALCQRCHNRHDARVRAAGLKARLRARRALGDLLS